MTLGDILLGVLVVFGFFVSAAVSRMFRRTMSGVIIGGVVGIAVSVTILFYGLSDLFAVAQTSVEN
jgi:heme O synthase-like polyprenyltransferase